MAHVLLESSGAVLLESGGFLLLELDDPVAPPAVPSSGGGGNRSAFPTGKPFRDKSRPTPVVVAHSLMDNLVDEYGTIHGREVYFAMERELKGPFAPGNKYDATTRPPQDVEVAHPIKRAKIIGPTAARKN